MLFTFILEFDGVNSVSQFSASDVDAAFEKWIQGLDQPYKYGLAKDQVETVKDALAARRQLHRSVNEVLAIDGAESELNLLSGMKNVWCVMGSAGKRRGKSVLVNIIATVPQTQKATARSRNKRGVIEVMK